jgi:glycogen operon protein
MILAGDEMGRTQQGNNNSYCQDNEIGWVDWIQLEREQHLFRFVKIMIRFRKQNKALRRRKFFEDDDSKQTKIDWHGRNLFKPDWSPTSRELVFHLHPPEINVPDIYVISNASPRKHGFQLPPPANGRKWHLKADTDLIPPLEIYDSGEELALQNQSEYYAGAHSTVILISKQNK